MRHRLAGRHLGRPTDHRLSMYRNLVTDLLRYERITTTEAKAKEIRPMAEKVITLGKRGGLHARRQALRVVYDGKVVKKVFDDIGPRFATRAGGYTRITALEARKGDGAKMASIELIDYVDAAPTPRPQRVTASPTVASRPAATVTTPSVPPSVPEEMGVPDEMTEGAEQPVNELEAAVEAVDAVDETPAGEAVAAVADGADETGETSEAEGPDAEEEKKA